MGSRRHGVAKIWALLREAAMMAAEGFYLRAKRSRREIVGVIDLTPLPIPHKHVSKPRGKRQSDKRRGPRP